MSFYDDSEYPVHDDIEAVHETQIANMGAPGTWGSGTQRRAVALAGREAAYDAGLLEPPVDADVPADIHLPDTTKRVIGKLATAHPSSSGSAVRYLTCLSAKLDLILATPGMRVR